MSWAETLKINSNMRKPIDKMNYELFYALAIVQNGGYGSRTSNVIIVPEYKSKIANNEYAQYGMNVLILPQTTTDIGSGSFSSCAELSFVMLPNGLEYIGGNAFASCSSLKSIRLPASIKNISTLAFSDCSNLTDIFVSFNEGEIEGAPWGATNATIHYNS